MCNFFILIFSIALLLIVIGIFVLCKYYRKIIRAREHAIVYHIKQQDKLKDEIKYINIEKKVMEKMLKKVIAPPSPPEGGDVRAVQFFAVL